MSRTSRTMGRLLALIALPALLLALPFLADGRAETTQQQTPVPAPEFTARATADWINANPLSISDLKGKVVLLDVWTFGCWNCYRSFPWLRELEARLAPKGLRVVGIHSPEFDHERDAAAVRAKAREFGLTHPIMLDNDFRYWKALNNRYWPAYYLLDKQGRIRARFFGETHSGTPQARQIEVAVEKLLAE
ncbi:MAG: redoxin domain-containing protein [Thiobacillus sp.]|nr:redoxin domain-containing protein [Thiobacillus sp.]